MPYPTEQEQEQQQQDGEELPPRQLDLSSRDPLVLYGLYKQATCGDAPHSSQTKSMMTRRGAARMNSWKEITKNVPSEELDVALQHMQCALAIVNNAAACDKNNNKNNKENNMENNIENNNSLSLEEMGAVDVSTCLPKTRKNKKNRKNSFKGAFSAFLTNSRPRAARATQRKQEQEMKKNKKKKNKSSRGSWGSSSPLAVSATSEDKTDTETTTAEEMLLLAAAEDDQETVRNLLEIPTTNIDYQDEFGQTALHVAVDMGFELMVKLLLEFNANVNAADNDGISVLQAAVISGQHGICQELLDRGADPDKPDNDGDSPRRCAMDDGNEILRRLFDGGKFCDDEEEDDDDEEEEEAEEGEDMYSALDGEEDSLVSWKTNFTLDQCSVGMVVDKVPSTMMKPTGKTKNKVVACKPTSFRP